MLKGTHGPQREEVGQLVSWLTTDLRPDLILFSNALLSGIVPSLRSKFDGPIVCLLQGDDIFLDALPDKWRQTSVDLVRENSLHFDRLLTHSTWYADHLAESLQLPRDRFDQIPLSLDCDVPVPTADAKPASHARTVGYFARLCPEKGIDNFLDAAARLLPKEPDLRFCAAGFLPELHRTWFEKRLAEVQADVGVDRLMWSGSPQTREAKFDLLRSFDLLCVPTNYQEPKGLFVLEAALIGLPALLPNHGAFPERIAHLGHGWTYEPNSADALDAGIREAVQSLNSQHSADLQESVTDRCSLQVTGTNIGALLESIRRNG